VELSGVQVVGPADLVGPPAPTITPVALAIVPAASVAVPAVAPPDIPPWLIPLFVSLNEIQATVNNNQATLDNIQAILDDIRAGVNNIQLALCNSQAGNEGPVCIFVKNGFYLFTLPIFSGPMLCALGLPPTVYRQIGNRFGDISWPFIAFLFFSTVYL